MAEKKSGLVKNIVLLMIVAACGVGVWFFLNKGSGTMSESAMREWFESSRYIEEGLDLEGLKQRLGHDAPQDLGEGRYRFDMARAKPGNGLVVDVVFRGNRAVSHTLHVGPDEGP